jgi:hypothetical protein
MANLVVTRTDTGGHRISQSYFSVGVALDANGNAISPRIANTNSTPVQGLDGTRFVYRLGDWLHLLPNVAAAGGAGGLANPVIGRYSSANLATISGVDAELGDRIEVPPTLARAFTPAIPGGVYRYVSLSPPTVQITDPPIYNLTHSSEVGGAVYYRANPNITGGLEGLASVPLTAGTVSQGRDNVQISNMPAFIDGNENSAADGRSLSWQNATMNITKVENILAFEWLIGSNRASYETGTTYAASVITVNSETNGSGTGYTLHSLSTTVNASTLVRHSSTTWANSAAGKAKYYAYLTTPTSVGRITCSEDTGHRTYYYDFKAIGFGRNCRIRLNNGTFPEAGSIINISQDVAKTFWPAVEPGAYPVINNSGTGPWQLGARFDLIIAIGSALNYSLYVDTGQYNASFSGAIRMEVGSLYQLRINTPEAATTAEYRIAQSGGVEESIGSSTNARSNFSVFFSPTVAQYNRALAGETAEIWALCNEQARPKRFNLEIIYTNKGRVNSPAPNAFISRINDIVISIVPDPARTLQSFNWTLSDADELVNQGTSATTSASIASFTTPAGDYTIGVEIVYTDTDRPVERFTVPITVLEFPEESSVSDNNGVRTLAWPGGGSLVMPTTPDAEGGVTIVATAPTTPANDPFISYFVTQIRSDGSRGQTASFISTFTADSTRFSAVGVAALEIMYDTQSGRRFTYTLTL